jgi:hypothetical protein
MSCILICKTLLVINCLTQKWSCLKFGNRNSTGYGKYRLKNHCLLSLSFHFRFFRTIYKRISKQSRWNPNTNTKLTYLLKGNLSSKFWYIKGEDSHSLGFHEIFLFHGFHPFWIFAFSIQSFLLAYNSCAGGYIAIFTCVLQYTLVIFTPSIILPFPSPFLELFQ